MLRQQAERHLVEGGLMPVVRNGYLSHRTIETTISDVDIKIPKIKDRSSNRICFNSSHCYQLI
ncbi:MAG: hypothetical protein ACTS73_00055 [Arsenophonus sp. NEOnobi-MAG3]